MPRGTNVHISRGGLYGAVKLNTVSDFSYYLRTVSKQNTRMKRAIYRRSLGTAILLHKQNEQPNVYCMFDNARVIINGLLRLCQNWELNSFLSETRAPTNVRYAMKCFIPFKWIDPMNEIMATRSYFNVQCQNRCKIWRSSIDVVNIWFEPSRSCHDYWHLKSTMNFTSFPPKSLFKQIWHYPSTTDTTLLWFMPEPMPSDG